VGVRWWVQSALLLGVFATAAPLLAQAANQVASQSANSDEMIQKLLDRVDALERQVAALEQGQVVQSPIAAVPEPAASDDATPPADAGSRFNFHGYADVDFQRNVDGNTKKFDLGEIDLFGTERLSPRWTALLELVLETGDQTEVAQVPVNVERLLLQYRGNQYFNLDIGSYRTAVGFYSTAFLRGAWLQTALSRPLLFNFEEQGGFLPLHNTGLSANGIVPSGGLGLHYVAEVGSSRNYGQNVSAILAQADNMGVNVALFARPPAVPGLEVGFSSYHDRFSPYLGMLTDRSVWMVHAVYQGHRIEFLNEGALATIRSSAISYGRIPAFYSQLAYRVKPVWTPYVRYEYANANGHDDQGFPHEYTPWRQVWLGGLRYDITEFAALKFELGHETSWLQPAWIRAAVQMAFTF
jgi:hypothetical protein